MKCGGFPPWQLVVLCNLPTWLMKWFPRPLDGLWRKWGWSSEGSEGGGYRWAGEICHGFPPPQPPLPAGQVQPEGYGGGGARRRGRCRAVEGSRLRPRALMSLDERVFAGSPRAYAGPPKWIYIQPRIFNGCINMCSCLDRLISGGGGAEGRSVSTWFPLGLLFNYARWLLNLNSRYGTSATDGTGCYRKASCRDLFQREFPWGS